MEKGIRVSIQKKGSRDKKDARKVGRVNILKKFKE
jgi:hypothetical protein